MAMAILKTVNVKSDPPRQCLFVGWDKVVRDIRTGYFSKDGSGLDEGATIKLLSDVDLLVIDDLGAELGL
ncbi:ATP-binding protein, partial [Streptococcus anginosus]|nr:ATP-binding protein [Streptococcus anginosus]